MAGFRHFRIDRKKAGLRLYELGVQLSRDCPLNDCVLYRNVFQMCRELDEQSDRLTGFPREVVDFTLQQRFLELKRLYDLNHAVREYRRSGAKKEPPVEGATPKPAPVPFKSTDIIEERHRLRGE
ncbi:hypothetical protein SDC9_120424 [bioreactor metagenome]|uniref:Uncharacterized protein n=1 Tax=bioreactor metagenome TaxID=1076179 RepID=A0A645C9Q8_9ZZZZ